MPDVTPIPDWVRLSHRAIVVYGALCLLAGYVVLWSVHPLAILFAGLSLMTPEIVLACLSGPLAFGLGHWIGDLVSKRREGHVVARMLARNAQSVHGTAMVLGTCGYVPLMLVTRQVEVSAQHLLMLGLLLFALALSASAHTARGRRRSLVAASYSAASYAAIGALISVFSGAMWMGAFALPFAAYFGATTLWLIRGPQWHEA